MTLQEVHKLTDFCNNVDIIVSKNHKHFVSYFRYNDTNYVAIIQHIPCIGPEFNIFNKDNSTIDNSSIYKKPIPKGSKYNMRKEIYMFIEHTYFN